MSDAYQPDRMLIVDKDDPSQSAEIVSGSLKVIDDNSATILAELQSQSALLTALNGYVDGLEGMVDGLEGFTDGLEGFVDGIEGLLSGVQAADGATAPANGIAIGGKDGSGNFQQLSVGSDGALNVAPAIPSTRQTSGRIVVAALPGGSNYSGAPDSAQSATLSANSKLRDVIVSSSKPLKVTIRTRNDGVDNAFGTYATPGDDTFVTYATFFVKAGETLMHDAQGAFTALAGERWEVVVQNGDPQAAAADAYVTINWE